MKIVDKGFDYGIINGMAIQFGIFLGILVMVLIALIILFKALKVPDKIAGTIAFLLFLVIAYYFFKLVIS